MNPASSPKVDPWYVTGFIDGEGCFTLLINTETKKRKAFKSVYRYWVVDFSVHLREDDVKILHRLQNFFGAGRVNLVGQGEKRAAHLSVRDLTDLAQKVVPHFESYPLQAKKARDFLLWREAVLILDQTRRRKKSKFEGQHLTDEDESRLHSIRELLTERLRGYKKVEFETNKKQLVTGKTRSDERN